MGAGTEWPPTAQFQTVFAIIRLWSGPPGHPGFQEVYFLRDIRNMLLTKAIEKFFFSLSLCPFFFFFLALQHEG